MSYIGNSIDSTPEVLQNKILQPRATTVTSAATLTPDSSTTEQFIVSALAVDATIAAPTGTPSAGQKLLITIKDNGTLRLLTWDAIYREVGVLLPTETVATKQIYVGCIYNDIDIKWDVIAVAEQI